MLKNTVSLEFVRLFKVPDVALPCLERIVSPEEVRLVLAGAADPLTVESARQALGVSESEAAEILESAFRRAVLDRDETDGQLVYRPTDFYTRLDIFATFDATWDEFPLEDRRALDEWTLDEYVERVRPNVERLKAGQPAVGSPGNDSILLLEELDSIVDAAITIAVFPCNCRRLGQRCQKPVETCVQFNGTAEKKLARGYGRRLTAKEAKALLTRADRKGLMHTTDLQFGEDGPAPICNCCADDCYVFRAAERLGSKGAWPRSRYVATHDPEACQMCGACVVRCHFGAFYRDGEMVERGGLQVRRVSFDSSRCRGCGLCTATCLCDAITLVPLTASSLTG
jgi:Pyruvate/2-oxoacid:ferredoxin oxidoreductase delta subunit